MYLHFRLEQVFSGKAHMYVLMGYLVFLLIGLRQERPEL